VSAEPLDQLRQVQGVLGSFTCGAHGQLLLTDMPPEYSLPDLESTAARIVNMFQTADEALPSCRNLSLGFGQHQLLARRHRAGLLCILTTTTPDRQLLKVTLRMVLRRLHH
jgi:hypothetical protein